MLPEERDAAHLWDMRDAALNIVEWVKDVSYEQFCEDEMLHSAVERKLEVFGEAAGRITAELQEAHPEIPWKEIKAVRVVLAHKYGDIDLNIIWEAAIRDLPELLPKLDALIPAMEK